MQHEQAQADPQYLLLAKHSQYSLRHLDLRQLHGLCSPSTLAVSCCFKYLGFTCSSLRLSWAGSTFSLRFVFSICSRIFLARIALFNVDACYLFWGKIPGVRPASNAACCLLTEGVSFASCPKLCFWSASATLKSRLTSRGLL